MTNKNRYIKMYEEFSALTAGIKEIIDGKKTIKDFSEEFGLNYVDFSKKDFPMSRLMRRMGYSEDVVKEWINEEKSSVEKVLSVVFGSHVDVLVDSIENEEKILNYIYNTLTDTEILVLQLRFGLLDGIPKTLEDVGKELGMTRERTRQIEAKVFRKLRHRGHPIRSISDIEGFKTLQERNRDLEEQNQKLLERNRELESRVMDLSKHVTTIEELDLSVKTYSRLKRAGINTVEDILAMPVNKLLKVRNLGRVSFNEIIDALKQRGHYLKNKDGSIVVVKEHVPKNKDRDLTSELVERQAINEVSPQNKKADNKEVKPQNERGRKNRDIKKFKEMHVIQKPKADTLENFKGILGGKITDYESDDFLAMIRLEMSIISNRLGLEGETLFAFSKIKGEVSAEDVFHELKRKFITSENDHEMLYISQFDTEKKQEIVNSFMGFVNGNNTSFGSDIAFELDFQNKKNYGMLLGEILTTIKNLKEHISLRFEKEVEIILLIKNLPEIIFDNESEIEVFKMHMEFPDFSIIFDRPIPALENIQKNRGFFSLI